MVSTRAQILTRRTYNRPKDDLGVEFETWSDTVGRVIDHQLWLWERALDRELNMEELEELELEEPSQWNRTASGKSSLVQKNQT